MEAQTTHEKQRLAAIEQKVKDVQDKLDTRLPAQHRHLTALACGAKWRLRALQAQAPDAHDAAKKLRLELGAFDYRVKEQAELLTRYLIELDDILSYGDADIKAARKALVVYIQQLLPRADAFKERSARLKQFGERLMAGLDAQQRSAPASPVDSGDESDDLHVKALFEEDEDSEEEPSDEEEQEAEQEQDEEMEEPSAVEDECMEPDVEADADEADDEAEEEEEDDDDEEEQVLPPQKKSPRLQPTNDSNSNSSNALDIDVNSLPVWRPYYQLQRRQDGIYLLARLGDTDPRNVRVQWNDRTGVLRIDGFRLPTQKDLLMSRLSGRPTFGRFEIAEQFPRRMLNMEEATQQVFEDGTLQIRMPYFLVQNPLRFRPSSLFQPQDCFVW